MQLTTRDAAAIFRKLELEPAPSAQHVRGYLVVDGLRILAVSYPSGPNPFPGNTADRLGRSLRLSRDELRRLAGCTLSRDEYVQLLIGRTAG